MAVPCERVLQARTNNQDMGNFLKFEEIPDSRYDEESLIGWLNQCGVLSELPKYLWTDLVLEAAAYWDSEALASIRPSDCEDFGLLVDLALSSNASSTKHIKARDFTEDFLIKICCEHPACMSSIDWYHGVFDLLTDKAITQIGSASITGMLSLLNYRPVDDKLITDEVVKSAIRNQPGKIDDLAEYSSYVHLIVEAVDDYWPTFTPMNLSFFERRNLDASVRPATVRKALECFGVSTDRAINVFFKVCVKKYPIEEVIETALDMPGGLNKLFDLYAHEELRHHTNKYRQLRGKFLEDALGM